MMSTTNTNFVRVRFAPSPTGYLHIGGARTVLFNWLVARKAGGAFVLRIEDTDRTRHVEDSVQKILNDLRWLGLDWDEGPETGGGCGPYFQSERLDLYHKYIEQLLKSNRAYYALETPQMLTTMREQAEKAGGSFRYQRPDPLPTIAQAEAARADGASPVVRFKMPDQAITVVDDILGSVTIEPEQFDDLVIQKGDGFPTYHFACVVDDELMQITHVLRGQEHLMNTPKHIAMQEALGFRTPRYGHMPVIFNMSGTKMSKRDKEKAIKKGEPPPEIDVNDFRLAGYLPESIVNFIALLGWNPGDDREQFSLAELTEAFSMDRVGKTNAKFDRDKLRSFNTDWCARVTPERLLAAFTDYLTQVAAVTPTDDPGPDLPIAAAKRVLERSDSAMLTSVLGACAGFHTFPDVLKKAGFLFLDDDAIEFDPKAVKKVLTKNNGAGYAMLNVLQAKFESHENWSAEALEALVKQTCEEKDTKMGAVAQPIRVAVSGGTISPGIGETLALLGQEKTIARVKRCIEKHKATP